MKKILIVGAGGFGREVYNWIDDSASQYPDWKILGFLDDDASCLEGYNYPLPIISTVEDYAPQKDEYLIMAIGNSQTRCVIVDELKRKNAQFETLIHKSTRLGKNVEMGEGCIICPDVIITYYPRPLHLQTAFSYCGHKEGDFPVAENASKCVLSLPMHPYINNENSENVSRIAKDTIKCNAYFGNIRTLKPELSGQHIGIIRTAYRKHPDTLPG